MSYGRLIYARVTIQWPNPHDEYLRARRRRYGRRMQLAGIRPASIERYLSRGFPGAFVRAVQSEHARLIADISYRYARRRRLA